MTTTLPFPNLCAQLYDGTLATGIKGHGPSSIPSVRVVEPHVIEEDDDIEVLNTEPPKDPSSSRKPDPPTIKNKSKRKQPMDDVDEEILGVLKVIANKINEAEPPPKPDAPTIEDCQNKMNDLGWAEDDPLYEVALAIFCEQNDRYREGWMQLKPERCVNWVKMIGRSKGFM